MKRSHPDAAQAASIHLLRGLRRLAVTAGALGVLMGLVTPPLSPVSPDSTRTGSSGSRGGPPEVQELKVYISADMEGVSGGVSLMQFSSEGPEWERFRRIMTGEVNAAAEAAFEAGAAEVVVSDSHGTGHNLVVEDLHPDVQLIRSWPRRLIMMEGIDESFDAAIFIGYHASEGTPQAIAAHTMSGGQIFDLRINGVSVPEGGFNAAIAGHFGVPVVVVSGDQSATGELRGLVGDVEEAVVKTALGNRAARTMHPSRSNALIAEKTRAALARIQDFQPYTPWATDGSQAGEVTLEIVFKSETDAELLSFLAEVERVDGSTIRYQAGSILDASGFLAMVIHHNRF
jgi:D-amino peptidase